jgi:hypothetical protein
MVMGFSITKTKTKIRRNYMSIVRLLDAAEINVQNVAGIGTVDSTINNASYVLLTNPHNALVTITVCSATSTDAVNVVTLPSGATLVIKKAGSQRIYASVDEVVKAQRVAIVR